MADYVDRPAEVSTALAIGEIRKIINKQLKAFGGFGYRPDKTANEFRCDVSSGGHSGGAVIVQLRDDGSTRHVRLVVTDAFRSRRLGMTHTLGVIMANSAADQIIKKVRKGDPSAAIRSD